MTGVLGNLQGKTAVITGAHRALALQWRSDLAERV